MLAILALISLAVCYRADECLGSDVIALIKCLRSDVIARSAATRQPPPGFLVAQGIALRDCRALRARNDATPLETATQPVCSDALKQAQYDVP